MNPIVEGKLKDVVQKLMFIHLLSTLILIFTVPQETLILG